MYTRVFISHANPEENYFAAWLYSRLKIAGYDTWCDLSNLRGGDATWREIERLIRNNASSFIFVLSEKSAQKRGTLRELALADQIRDRGEFIIPARIDDFSFNNLPAELAGKNVVDFYNKWEHGFKDLRETLEKKEVPKSGILDTNDILAHWYQGIHLKENILLEREEPYLTNWFEITLPEKIWIYKPGIGSLAQFQAGRYPRYREKEYFISFACPKCIGENVDQTPNVWVNLQSYLSQEGALVEAFGDKIKAFNKKIIALLNDSIGTFLKDAGLEEYVLSNRSPVFFFPSQEKKTRISLKELAKSSIQLNGKFRGNDWHFGLEAEVFLQPTPAYFFGTHVIFERNGKLLSKEKQHSARRAIGKSWYNKKWSDLLMGAIVALSKDAQSPVISVPVCCSQSIGVNKQPIVLSCSQGFSEPTGREVEISDD